jgi:fibro-slime domain-containing protein
MRRSAKVLVLVTAALTGCESPPPSTTGGLETGGTSSTAGSAGTGAVIAGSAGTSSAGSSATGGSAGTVIIPVPMAGASTAGGGGTAGGLVETLPPDFTGTDAGGFKLGEPVMPGGAPPVNEGKCNNLLTGIVRDFKGLDQPDGHPNFQMDLSGTDYGVREGLVAPDLGADFKPLLAGDGISPVTTGPLDFAEWYVNTDTKNMPYYLTVWLAPTGTGIFTFQSDSFFPLDGAGFNDSNTNNMGDAHNYFFTFELHTTFNYRGGETFTFIGDDDVWIFINGKLAVDIGGVHEESTASVDLDERATELGITVGSTYALDMFQAERHTVDSNFRIDTSLSFDCSVFVPEPR